MNSHDPSNGDSVGLALIIVPAVIFVALVILYSYAPVADFVSKLKGKRK